MSKAVLATAPLLLTGALLAGGPAVAGAPPGGEAVAGGGSREAPSSTFPTRESAGRSDFRHARFEHFSGPDDGGWGFASGRRPGEGGGGRAFGHAWGDYGLAPPGFPLPPPGGYAGYGPGPGPGPYGIGAYPGYGRAFRPDRAYVSGQGAYSYGYPGYAQTPALPWLDGRR